MTTKRRHLLAFVSLAGFAAFAAATGDDRQRATAPASPPESDAEKLIRETKQTAPYAAAQILSKRLKAPTQAKFSDRKLVEQKDNFALVSVVVDAPNSFGAMLRSTQCYIVKFEPPRGANFSWNQEFGVWDCSTGIDEQDLLVRKVAAQWPGSTGEFEARFPHKSAKKKTVR